MLLIRHLYHAQTLFLPPPIPTPESDPRSPPGPHMPRSGSRMMTGSQINIISHLQSDKQGQRYRRNLKELTADPIGPRPPSDCSHCQGTFRMQVRESSWSVHGTVMSLDRDNADGAGQPNATPHSSFSKSVCSLHISLVWKPSILCR